MLARQELLLHVTAVTGQARQVLSSCQHHVMWAHHGEAQHLAQDGVAAQTLITQQSRACLSAGHCCGVRRQRYCAGTEEDRIDCACQPSHAAGP
jgi:hypothetical protein